MLTFRDYPGYSIDMYSDEVAEYLKILRTNDVPVVFDVTSGFGRVVAFSEFESFWSSGFHLKARSNDMPNQAMQRATSFLVFFLGGSAIGLFTFRLLMFAVWGAPTHLVQYVALFSSVLLLVGAFVCLFAPVAGRDLATASILGIGTLYIPASASLVPLSKSTILSTPCLAILSYFALLAFALFFPRRWRWSVPLLVSCLLVSVAFAATTSRYRSQELTVVCLHYSPGDAPLRIEDRFSALTPEDIALLQRCVPGGTAEVHEKGIYDKGPKAKAILLLTGPFDHKVSAVQPWRSTVIYLQEGQSLTILPKDVPIWDKHLYVEQQRDEPSHTTYMVDLPTGGQAGGSAGAWKP